MCLRVGRRPVQLRMRHGMEETAGDEVRDEVRDGAGARQVQLELSKSPVLESGSDI
jgi:hypothetical protein